MSATTWILYDTEFTSWPDSQRTNWEGRNRELVRISALRIDRHLRVVDIFDVLCRPVVEPVLSSYFMNLTGITQEEIEAEGVSISEGLARFFEFCDGDGSGPILSYGNDRPVIEENLRGGTRPSSILSRMHDVRPLLEATLRRPLPSYLTSGTVYKAAPRLEQEVSARWAQASTFAHNSLWDVYSPLLLLRHLRGFPSLVLEGDPVF